MRSQSEKVFSLPVVSQMLNLTLLPETRAVAVSFSKEVAR